jgi:putative flippase GtrA
MQKEKKEEIFRVVKYVLFSASAGVIQTLAFTLLNEIVKWPYWPCYLIALVLSVLWNFTLNRTFTFQSATTCRGPCLGRRILLRLYPALHALGIGGETRVGTNTSFCSVPWR